MTPRPRRFWMRLCAVLVLTMGGAMVIPASLSSQDSPPATSVRPQARDVLPESSRAGTGSIRGRVVDAPGGLPLRGVRIQAVSRNAPDVFTDGEGRFTLASLTPERYRLAASKAGYVTVWRDRAGSGNEVAGPAVDLADGQVVEQVDFVLPKGGTIVGRVVDDRGREVIGATVAVYRSRWRDGLQQMTPIAHVADRTNDLGEFRLFGLPAGTYLLGASFNNPAGLGLLTVYYPGSFLPDGGEPVTVRPGEERSVTMTLARAPVASIEGTVRLEGGQPPDRGVVTVSARLISHFLPEPVSGIGTRVRADGSYTLPSLLPGEYQVSASTSSTAGRLFASAHVILDGKEVTVPLTLSTGGTIRGRYRFDTGAPPADLKPPSGAGVMPVVLPHDDARRMTVGPDWHFEVTGLHGAYRLVPSTPAGWFVKRITLDDRDVQHVPVEVTGNAVEGVDVLLTQQSTRLSVSLEGSDAQLEDTTILLFAEDESKLWQLTPFLRAVRTDRSRQSQSPSSLQWHDRRSFTVSGLPPARYHAVAVAKLESGEETNPALLRRLASIAARVELVDGETRTIALKVTQLP